MVHTPTGRDGVLVAELLGSQGYAVRRSVTATELDQQLDDGVGVVVLAQGLGRLGNWWNQELFGKPTDLPWGLEIDPVNRPLDHLDQETFHPTFLYELLWDFGAAAFLVFVIERRLRPRPPGVFAAYIVLYCIGRFGEELLRIDPAHHVAGLRLNAWVSLIGIAAGAVWYVLSQRADRPARPRRRKEKPAPPGRKMAVPHGKRVRPPG